MTRQLEELHHAQATMSRLQRQHADLLAAGASRERLAASRWLIECAERKLRTLESVSAIGENVPF